MKAIQEYNGVETYFHGISQYNFNQLLAEANGKVEDIVLYGRVFNPDLPLREAEAAQDYEEVRGEGYIYACQYEDRENATPGASVMIGMTLILGWDGVSSVEPVSKGGEMLVPVAGYTVLGSVD